MAEKIIKTIVLDDDPNSCLAARSALAAYKDFKVISCFQKSDEFFAYLEENDVDLVFLDIELDREFGFDVAKKLNYKYPKVLIIFFTGHTTYAIESFDFKPVYFLSKPINPAKMATAVELVRQRLAGDKAYADGKLMFKAGGEYHMVKASDICYFERRNRKLFLVTESEEIRISNYSFNELLDMLENYGFMICYQSFIISIRRIERFWCEEKQNYYVSLMGRDEKIPVSRTHVDDVRKCLTE